MPGTTNQNFSEQSEKIISFQIFSDDWWRSFLACGAILRLASDELLCWSGPFETVVSSPSFEKDPKFSIGYMEFFDSTLNFRRTQNRPQRIKSEVFSFEIQKFISQVPVTRTLLRADFTHLGFADFEKNFQAVMGRIHREEIDKAVPVIFHRSAILPSLRDRISWILNLLKMPKILHVYGFWEPEFGILGATPEILFSRKQEQISTMALAGTMPRSEVGKRNSLLKDNKEILEHAYVVQDLDRQLGRWGRVHKTGPQILELPSLLHLQTLIEVQGVHCSSAQLIQQLHPTAALGVAPRAYGYQWLKQLSDQEGRRFFGAPFIFSIPDGAGEVVEEELCVVAIRNIQWDSEECRVGAGCGVIKESLAESEWQELLQKTHSIFDMLGIQGPQP